MLKSLWLVHNCSDYYVSIITTVLLTLIDGLSFSFLKHPCRKTHHGHIPVKIHQGQRVKEWLERRMKNHFHTWISSSESRTYSLKVFGMCWRRLYRVLDSCIVNTRSSPKMYAPPDGNNITTFISIKRCIPFFRLSFSNFVLCFCHFYSTF